MKKIISIALVLILCLSCCFAFAACSDDTKADDVSETKIFDEKTKQKIAKICLEEIVSGFNAHIELFYDVDKTPLFTDKTTIKDIIDVLVDSGETIVYAYLDEDAYFLSICEKEEYSYLTYQIRDDIEISSYYSDSSDDVEAAKEIIVRETLWEIVDEFNYTLLVSNYEERIIVTEQTTIYEVVDFINQIRREQDQWSLSVDYINTKLPFCGIAEKSGYVEMDVEMYHLKDDIEWLDYFAV